MLVFPGAGAVFFDTAPQDKLSPKQAPEPGVNADHQSERSERAGATILPPAVTRWRKPSARIEYQAPMAPPFRAAARNKARVVLEPVVPEPLAEAQAVQAPTSKPEEPAVAPLTLAPSYADEIAGSDAPLVPEPLDMVEFGAMIEPLENGKGEDPRHDAPFELADEIGLEAEQEAIEVALAPLEEATAANAEVEPVFIAIEPTQQAQHPHQDLSERLLRLSQRLREERMEDLLASLAAGDRVDHLMAGFLAGYFSTKND